MVLGGISACSDHNPTVTFTTDAGTTGKSEAGTSLDGGGNHDGGLAPDAVGAADVGGTAVDVSSSADQALDVNPSTDAANPLDVGVDRQADLAPTVDTSAALDNKGVSVDGAGASLDGPGTASIEVGTDSASASDLGGTGG